MQLLQWEYNYRMISKGIWVTHTHVFKSQLLKNVTFCSFQSDFSNFFLCNCRSIPTKTNHKISHLHLKGTVNDSTGLSNLFLTHYKMTDVSFLEKPKNPLLLSVYEKHILYSALNFIVFPSLHCLSSTSPLSFKLQSVLFS